MARIFLVLFAVCFIPVSSAWGKIGGGEITFPVKGAANVVYSHEFHVEKAGLKCTDCHYRVYPMGKAARRATMADMSKGGSCGACHNGEKAFAIKENCKKCHK